MFDWYPLASIPFDALNYFTCEVMRLFPAKKVSVVNTVINDMPDDSYLVRVSPRLDIAESIVWNREFNKIIDGYELSIK